MRIQSWGGGMIWGDNGNILVSTGLKSTKLSMEDSSSEYSFSVSEERPRMKTLPR